MADQLWLMTRIREEEEVAQRVFTAVMRIMQPANRGLACRIPSYRSQSGLFSALAVNVREAHEYMRAIQPCNTHLYCIVVTSWHCVLHHKLAIKLKTDKQHAIIYGSN